MATMMIDKLAYSSPLRYKNAFLKVFFSVGTLMICVAARSFLISSVILLVMGCLTIAYSRASFSRYLRMMTAPFVFLLMGTIAIVADFADSPMGIWSMAIGSKYLVITVSAIIYAARLILVSLASVACLYFLILTTTMQDLLTVMRKAHFPWILMELMMLIYRFLFVLLDWALAITTAQKCRLGYHDFRTSVQSMGQMLAAVLILSMKKSSVIFDAMEARCYDGQIRVLEEYHKAERKDMILVAGALTVLLIAAVWCHGKGDL